MYFIIISLYRAEEFIKAGSRLHSKAIIFILPNEKEDRYNAIKKFFCVEQPKITQVWRNLLIGMIIKHNVLQHSDTNLMFIKNTKNLNKNNTQHQIQEIQNFKYCKVYF